MKSAKAPTPPDPNQIIQAQTQSNQQTAAYNAALNRGNTYTPMGSSEFTQRIDPNTGAAIWDQTVKLSPEQQALLDTQNRQDLKLGSLSNNLVDQATNNYGSPLDTSGLPQVRTAPEQQAYQRDLSLDGLPELFGSGGNVEDARRSISDALYNRQSAYLDPQYAQREEQLRTRLATQGITQNSEAWNSALDELNRSRSFDYAQARDSSIADSGTELQRLSDIARANRGEIYSERLGAGNFANSATGATNADALRSAGFNNQASAQALSQALTERNEPLNELSAIRGATSVETPQFNGAARSEMGPVNAAGNIWNNYNSLLNIWNAQTAGQNDLLGGLMGLGGQLGGALITKPPAKVA